MATWPEVRNYLLSNYQVSEDDGTLMAFLFDTPGGRSQSVYVGVSPDQQMLIIQSPVGEANMIDGNVLLALTANSGVSVKQAGDYYVTLHVAPIEDLNTTELLEPMERVMLGADALEEALGLGDAM